jgi:kinesin family member 6/9
MTGPEDDDFAERGLCMRTAGCLFERSRRINATEFNSVSIRLSVLEIYNESITDLLRNASSITPTPTSAPPPSTTTATTTAANNSTNSGMKTTTQSTQKLSIVDTPNGIIIPGLYLLPLSSEEDAYNLLFEAYSNRVVAEHQLNRRSSRSHVIYTFYVTRTRLPSSTYATTSATTSATSSATSSSRHDSISSAQIDIDPEVINSKLHLIDLAGSERVDKTGSTGTVQKEASHINRSLTFLEQVVIALTQSRRDHIPYRQSKLTYLLKDCFGGNCHTYMVACVWPHEKHAHETLSTLR